MRTGVRITSGSPPETRLPLLDAIRGVALGGILLANLMSFFGADMLDAAARRAMPGGGLGEAVLFAINWLVEGKFYSIFSMLLGAGFALQVTRAADQTAFAPFFRRRMAILIVIGLTHMFVLWSGDILTLYGVMGLLLPSLFRLPARTRTLAMLVLFLVPLSTHTIVVATHGRADPRVPFANAGATVRERLDIANRPTLDVFAHEGAARYLSWNTANAIARPGTYLQSGRPAKVLALFLLGAWLAAAVLPRLETSRRWLLLTIVVGGAIGLASSYAYASIKAGTGSTFLLSSLGLMQTTAYTAGTTPLALAYLAAAALAWRTSRGQTLLAWFVPLGRMALSVYVSQTIVQLALFSGYGLGWAGRVSLAWLPALAATVLVAQRYLCAWWLRRHAQGPLERVWRQAALRHARD